MRLILLSITLKKPVSPIHLLLVAIARPASRIVPERTSRLHGPRIERDDDSTWSMYSVKGFFAFFWSGQVYPATWTFLDRFVRHFNTANCAQMLPHRRGLKKFRGSQSGWE